MSKDIAPDSVVTEATLRQQLLDDYRLCCLSREMSLLGRKEVLTGKAKFGIFGDGKELAQVALAKVFQKGDFRSGYYRDQTWMMALGELEVQPYFAALYAHASLEHEPTSGGRQMGGHYATRSLDDKGAWKNLMEQYNSSADISPTAGQMPRLLGLAQASKVYKAQPELAAQMTDFTNGGNEIAFGSIGDASTSEGLFWETMNAACVLEVPMLMSVWDDGYGISVEKKYQTVKESISEALAGFEKGSTTNGLKIFRAKGWNYPELVATYERAAAYCRDNHTPVLVHVEQVTQPQGHSTSGSHERYKTPERLAWAEEYDCINQFKSFIALEGGVSEEELDAIRKEAKKEVRAQQKAAWAAYRSEIDGERDTCAQLLRNLAAEAREGEAIAHIAEGLASTLDPIRKDVLTAARQALMLDRGGDSVARKALAQWHATQHDRSRDRYSDRLYSASQWAATNIEEVAPEYNNDGAEEDGRIILRENFRTQFERRPEVLTFGEDTGVIGGVNQAMEGMQDAFGKTRVSDTGIREATIMGQGIGMAMRGLRPIAEIQYLDYLYYALQIMRDDLATVHYRTRGGQKAPLIVRTRGHRLEGIWHSGSPMGAIIHSVRGMIVAVPRNMTQAAGMYNTLLESDDPALVVECLNGYRSKEPLPTNMGDFRTPIGKAEVVREGADLTIVSYGSTFNLCMAAAERLAELDIDVELVDVRTLLPFDLDHGIAASLGKTNRLLIVDEDVPGGASAFILDQVLNKQGGYQLLDSAPVTLAAQPHLPAYSTDGDYFSKPSIEDITEAAYAIMQENDPGAYPEL